MSDLVLRIRNGIWQVTGTLKVPGREKGVRVRESTGTARLKDAEAYRDNLRKELVDRETLGPAYTLTFADCVVIYLEKGGERRYMKPILERFGALRLRDITANHVSDFAIQQYGHMTKASVKRYFYTPFNAALRKGCEANKIPVTKFEGPKIKKGDRAVVDPAPVEWFPQFMRAAFFRLASAALFITMTGARVQEMCNVTPRDCFLYGKRPHALLRKTKNGQPRVVVLDEILVRAIEALIREERLKPDDRVFGYSQRWSFNQAVERVCRKAGIQYYSSHKLGRHAFSARILAEGGSLKQVQEAGGWSSYQIVADIYGHLEHKAVDQIVLDRGSQVSQLLSGTQLTHSHKQQLRRSGRRKGKTTDFVEKPMVGTIGFEPMTPTMSRAAPQLPKDQESVENSVVSAESSSEKTREPA